MEEQTEFKKQLDEFNKNAKDLERAMLSDKTDDIYLVIGFHDSKPAFDMNGNPIVLRVLAKTIEQMIDESLKQLDEKQNAMISIEAVSDIQKIMKSFLEADDDNGQVR